MNINPTIKQMALEFYTKNLVKLNPILLITPASLVKLNRQVEEIRIKQKQRGETNPVWNLLVEVITNGKSPTHFQVIFREENL